MNFFLLPHEKILLTITMQLKINSLSIAEASKSPSQLAAIDGIMVQSLDVAESRMGSKSQWFH
jgi:hypothetical protein